MIVLYEIHFIILECSILSISFQFESAADSHSKLLDRAFNLVKFLLAIYILILSIAGLLVLNNNDKRPFHSKLPQLFQQARLTRFTAKENYLSFSAFRFNTTTKSWNSLPD